MTKCRNQALKCKFRDTKELEERLIEQLIIGTKHCRVQSKLLEKSEFLSLDEATSIAKTYEITCLNLEEINKQSASSEKEIHAVYNRVENQPGNMTVCNNCGIKIPANTQHNCPARGSVCNNCDKINHWARVCRSRNMPTRYERRLTRDSRNQNKQYQKQGSERNTKYYQIFKQNNEDEDDFETITFKSIIINKISEKLPGSCNEIQAVLNIKVPSRRSQNCKLEAKVDTGAQGNILPLRLYRQIYPEQLDCNGKPKGNALNKSNTTLTAYGGFPLIQYGTIRIPCAYEGNKSDALFYVTEADGPAVVGLPTSQKLGFVIVNCNIEKYDMPKENKSKNEAA